jgi:hypothetical protein
MKLQKAFHALAKIFGYKPVHLTGQHCGCCGTWIQLPQTLLRKNGQSRPEDGWGLCRHCAQSPAQSSQLTLT